MLRSKLSKLKHWYKYHTDKAYAKEYDERQAYIELNNLYLQVQRGEKRITTKMARRMRQLVMKVYPKDDMMQNWWFAELQKLPRWFHV
jgi:hypothetical protein